MSLINNSIRSIKIVLIIMSIAALSLMEESCVRRHSHRDASTTSQTTTSHTTRRHSSTRSYGKATVKMRFSDGVYYVPCVINGTNMEFIFDTGASNIVMSLTEALFLFKQGKLSDDDIVDNVVFQIADGSIGEGTVVNLKTVAIGDKTLHNVRATIISNMEAPLLLGQSALSRFGKLSIDYNRNEITFE